MIGSKSDVCDPDTGACDCLPGVTGIACGQCLPLHYGFLESPPGCQSCDCHPKGNPYIVTYVLFHILWYLAVFFLKICPVCIVNFGMLYMYIHKKYWKR